MGQLVFGVDPLINPIFYRNVKSWVVSEYFYV